jgi:hypothetical protein
MDNKFLRTNLFILLGYAVLTQLLALVEQNGGAMMVLIVMMILVALHAGILALGALILLLAGDKVKAGQWILNALLVGVIGFGTCWGGAQVAELYSGPAHIQ